MRHARNARERARPALRVASFSARCARYSTEMPARRRKPRRHLKAPKSESVLSYNRSMKPLVGIIMGSSSDWETMQSAAEMLDKLSIPFELRVVSAHRTPDLLFEYASTA